MKNQAAQWLIAQRKSQNLSLRELATRTGLTHTTIAKAEDGEGSFETWQALAKYFDEDPKVVLSWANKLDAVPEVD